MYEGEFLMIKSPQYFIETHKDKSYDELLLVRDSLMKDIMEYEEYVCKHVPDIIDPSAEADYKYKLICLGELCKLIAEKYDYESALEVEDQKPDCEQDVPIKHTFLDSIRDYLEQKGLLYDSYMMREINLRREGKTYTIGDHVKVLIYSMLSAQTKWYRIQEHLTEIDKLFYNYNPTFIMAADPSRFVQGLFDLKCGNRSTKKQMYALNDNIQNFQRIQDEYGSIDGFITSDSPEEIVQKLSKSSSKYKMKILGEALAWEYLRNVGIDAAKPDTHLCRFLGADRMGTGKKSLATIKEVNEQVTRLAKETGMTKVEIDNLIWSFCADGYGAVCTAQR